MIREAGNKEGWDSERAEVLRPAAQRLRRSKGSAQCRLRAVRAPAELAETGPERSGAETERGRSGDGAGARAVPKRRSERSIPKSREAATAFSPR